MWRLETSRVELQKYKGIYIIMYANPRFVLQEVQGGFMCEMGIFLGGFMEGCQDLDLDLGITKVCWGLCAKRRPHLLPLLDPETG
jgi:hypothetical protein